MTTALYRRYRPETFAEVIGQEHVTGPLMQALRSGRVNHAYLFSGPRGCGKTTSARILARTLNCHRNTPESPIDTPCGACPSCVELARGGSGSLDVVEIDAASHGGVDDARDLRERATFAPARDRYKIFVIDEAHMVSPAGFNALLKIVEEPPPHIKFVFATTEPDKVIGTIRSRTHHYPFRLVPPDVLSPYLESLCASEGVSLGGGVVPLVVRAGGGSVRDSLSVLDQLIAGASGGVVDYDLAVGLLGYTHSSLLDDVVDALAARDGASLFRVVDQLIASGHAPQRFVDDLLERLRDLIVMAVSGDAADAVLRGQPADQLERMAAQAARLGMAELSRAADLVNAALTEMSGATSPRLHLELLCARLLLPGADEGAAGLAARVERLERGGLAAGSVVGRVAPQAGASAAAERDDDGGAAPTTAGSGGLRGAAAARAAYDASRRRVTGRGGEPQTADNRAGEGPDQPSAVAPAVREPAVREPAVREPAAADDVPPASGPEPAPAFEPEREPGPAPVAAFEPEPETEPAPAAAPQPEPAPVVAEPGARGEQGHETEPGEGPATAVTTEVVRRRWREALASIGNPRAEAFLGEHAQVQSLEDGVLRLAFPQALVEQARRGRPETISDAVYETLGLQVRVEIVSASGPRPRDASSVRTASDDEESDDPAPARAVSPTPRQSGRPTSEQPAPAAANAPRPSAPAGPAAGGDDAFDEADAAWLAGAAMYEPPTEDEPEPPADLSARSTGTPAASAGRSATSSPTVRSAPSHTPSPAPSSPASPQVRPSAQPSATSSSAPSPSSVESLDPYDDAAIDDPDIASTGLVGVPLVVKLLNGTIIDERLDHS